jgi:hypothetical protein
VNGMPTRVGLRTARTLLQVVRRQPAPPIGLRRTTSGAKAPNRKATGTGGVQVVRAGLTGARPGRRPDLLPPARFDIVGNVTKPMLVVSLATLPANSSSSSIG